MRIVEGLISNESITGKVHIVQKGRLLCSSICDFSNGHWALIGEIGTRTLCTKCKANQVRSTFPVDRRQETCGKQGHLFVEGECVRCDGKKATASSIAKIRELEGAAL